MKTEFSSFDTHDMVKAFVKGGMKEPLAEIVVKAISETRSYDISQLATKLDLMEVEKRLSVEIERAKYDVVKWQIGTIIALSSIMVACFKFFTH